MSDIPISFRLQIEGDSEVKGKLEGIGSAMQELGKKSESTSRSAMEVVDSHLSVATSFGEVVKSGLEAYDSYKKLEGAQLRIAQAEKSVDTARASLLKSQDALTKMIDEGAESGAQYEAAQLGVKAAEEQLAMAGEKAKSVHEDFARAQLDFALGVAPLIKGGIDAVQGAMGALRAAKIIDVAATATQTAANLGAAGSFAALGAAATAAGFGMRAFSVATRLAQLAMGPIGIAILGVSTFMALFATNAFGIRDSINAAGKAIGDAIPVLRPLLEMLGSLANSIFPETTESAADCQAQMEGTGAATAGLGQAAALAAKEVRTFQDYIDDLNDSVAGQRQENEFYLKSIGAITDATQYSNENLEIAANYYQEQERAAFSARQELVFMAAGQVGLTNALGMTDQTLRNLTDSMRQYQASASGAKESVDSLYESEKRRSNRLSSGEDIEKRAKAADLIGKNAKMTGHRGSITSFVEHHAAGGTIYEPTLMMGMNSGRMGIMAEAGPETIMPVGARAGIGNRPIMITVVTTLDGREVARTVSRYQAESI